MDYGTKNHTKFLILYHLIFVCKYRKKLLERWGETVKAIFFEIRASAHFSFEEMQVDRNQIHCLVKSEPPISPLAVVRRLKQQSTPQLWQRYESELQTHFWRERTFWSDGCFCCTIGNASQAVVRKYIKTQGQENDSSAKLKTSRFSRSVLIKI
ncbi:MAG: IS200/IS605 family transposase [Ktedonobacterales bacterium]